MAFTFSPADFFWATGIEDTFIPQARPGLRSLDEYELTQHYQNWQTDFHLATDTGARFLRWGLPWYRLQPQPDQWDWRWADAALDYLVNVTGLTPILDLMHYGTPLWMESSFIDPSYPERVAEYAARVSERYGALVRWYTPLNEPMINAVMCGQNGTWPPYLKGAAGYVRLVLALARGIVHTTRALQMQQPDCTTVQVEALWRDVSDDPSLARRVAQSNARQFLAFDLVTGRVGDDHFLRRWLLSQGAGETELRWFQDNAIRFDILGANFYPWSYAHLSRGRSRRILRSVAGVTGYHLREVIQAAYDRYQMPVMITETSAKRDVPGRAQWMDETIDVVCQMRQSGVPLVGYTWFPMLSMIDWSYRTGRRPLKSYLLHLGLYDCHFDPSGKLVRRATPLVNRYQNYTRQALPEIP
jgi:beta-glucosidase